MLEMFPFWPTKWPHILTHTHTHTHTHTELGFFMVPSFITILQYYESSNVLTLRFDGIEDTIYQNMASWHIEYLGPRKFERTAKAGRSLQCFPWPLFPKNSSQNFHVRVPFSYPQERRILLSEDKGTPRRIWIGLARFPPVYSTHLIFLNCHISASSLSNLAWKHSGLNVSSRSSIPSFPVTCNSYIK